MLILSVDDMVVDTNTITRVDLMHQRGSREGIRDPWTVWAHCGDGPYDQVHLMYAGAHAADAVRVYMGVYSMNAIVEPEVLQAMKGRFGKILTCVTDKN